MTITYISTRGGGEPQTFEQVLLSGLAPDGGLYVPQTWPQLDLDALRGKSYQDIAEAVMFPFVEGCIPREDFRSLIDAAYQNFRHDDIVPLVHSHDNVHILELFHGPTLAFKDVALQLLGRLFDYVLTKNDQTITIVGATSGDTGSAAIEGCYASDRIQMFILFPDGKVSDVQRKQMTTINAPNVHNIAVKGTFDDCQSAVKAMFNDPSFRTDMRLSAINSINWARIMAQIVYYVTSALELGAPDKEVSYVVPTGNFGNVYAAYCASKMGLPIQTLGIATNKNDILTRFFESGTMDAQGVTHTISPSMDIQISSNFERYLFEALGRDSEKLRSIMELFAARGRVDIEGVLDQGEFQAFRADDEETLTTIKHIHEKTGYVLDPHTAVGMSGALKLASEDKDSAIISLACAHPAKFPDAVERAIHERPALPPHLADLFDKEECVTRMDNDIDALKNHVRKTVQS